MTNLHLLDLTDVMSMLMAFGGVSALLSYARVLFLDHLLAGLSATQRDYALRGIAFLLNLGLVLALSIFIFGHPFSLALLISALIAAGGGFGLSHVAYHASVATKQSAEPAYPEIPDGDGLPPTDAPQSAVLASAA